MSSDNFLKRVADTLKLTGMEASFDGITLTVGTCKFDAYYRKTGKEGGTVRFADGNFKVDKDGNFDLARAVGCLIAAIPKKLEDEKKRTEFADRTIAVREYAGNKTGTVGNDRYQIWYRVSDTVQIAVTQEGYELKLHYDDFEKLKALLATM